MVLEGSWDGIWWILGDLGGSLGVLGESLDPRPSILLVLKSLGTDLVSRFGGMRGAIK